MDIKDDGGNVIGRIAAFISKKYNNKLEMPTL